MAPIRVLLVDDHEVVRIGLRSLLELEPDIVVAGEAGDGDAAVAQAVAVRPDVAILDVRMGEMDGITACREIRSRCPQTAVLMLTSFGTEEAVLASVMAGASGFLLKNAGRAALLQAVRALALGQSLLDPAVTRTVMHRLAELTAQTGPSEVAHLSEREREVLLLLAEGLTNRAIADRLIISEATARNHVSHILEKLGLSRRSQAAALAARLGLLPGEPRPGV
jgi:DNA-binding NarL/FixJ family response regulator